MKKSASLAIVLSIVMFSAVVVYKVSQPQGDTKVTRERQSKIAADPPAVSSSSEVAYPLPLYFGQNDASRRYRSIWQDSVKTIYREKLARSRPDILVLPFEVQVQPIDKIGRSLMTRYLIERLRALTSKSVSDFDLVDRSLGYNRSRFLDEDIRSLLREVRPQTYIRTFVGQRSQGLMYLTVVVYSRDPGNPKDYREVAKNTWSELSFDDIRYPYQIFSQTSMAVARLILPDAREVIQETPRATGDEEKIVLPESPTDFMAIADDNPVQKAFALQTLGMLTPDSAVRERHRFFEKSLMVLEEIPSSHPDFTLLKARALFYLARRPGAVDILEGTTTREGEALRYYLNANLVALAESVERISSPWKKMLARLELHNLAVLFMYEKQIPPSWKTAFFQEYPKWKLIVTSKLDEYSRSRVPTRAAVKKALDEFLPLPAFSLETTLVSVASQQRSTGVALVLTEAVANHTLAALESTQFVSERSSGVTPDDYVHLLDGLARFNAIHELRQLNDIQDLPEKALATAKGYLEIYAGHPDLLVHEVRANAQIWKKERGVKRSSSKAALPEALERLADLALEHDGEFFRYYEHIQKIISELEAEADYEKDSFGTVKRRRNDYAMLFPPRFTGRANMESTRRLVEYAHADINVLQYAIWKISNNNKADAKLLLEENQNRFVGHRSRPEVLAWAASVIGDNQSMETYYSAAVESGSLEWSPYWEMLVRHTARGEYEQGLAVIEKYPGFLPASSESPIRLSNRAYKAGSLLFWKGAHEQAMPLYELSASYGTGSAAEMASLARIATIQGDYATALLQHFKRGRRYNSPFGYRDAMSLLQILGESEQAWALFDSLAGVFETPDIWMSALVGHRVARATSSDIEAWVSNESRMVSTHKRFSFPARFGLMALTMDRAPDDEAPAIIERLGRGYETRVIETRPGNPDPALTIEGKSGMPFPVVLKREFGRTDYRVGEQVESEYSLFARGYNALKRKQYEDAYRLFMRSQELYGALYPVPSHFLFPYLMRAALKADRPQVVEAGLEIGRKRGFDDSHEAESYDWYLGKTFLAAENGDHDAALKLLKRAFGVQPRTGLRPIMTSYQTVEAGLWLFEDSGDPRYLSLALEWSKDYQVVAPMYAWPYAVEAQYSDIPEARRRALGIALYLDQDSWLLSAISDSDKEQARRWFEQSKPLWIREPRAREPVKLGS